LGYNAGGPVACSLAIRNTPVLERPIVATPDSLQEIAECVQRARRFRSIHTELGISRHPLVIEMLARGSCVQTSEWAKKLGQIIYRFESDAMFRDLSTHGRKHKQRQDRVKRQGVKFTKKDVVDQRAVLSVSLVSHLRQTLPLGAVLSIPSQTRVVEKLSSCLASSFNMAASPAVQPPTQPQPSFCLDQGDDDDDMSCNIPQCNAAEADVPGAAAMEPQPLTFFRILHMLPHRWKTIPTPVIVGGRISANAIAVAPLVVVGGSEAGGHIVCNGQLTDIGLLQRFTGADLSSMRNNAMWWSTKASRSEVTLQGLQLPGCTALAISHVVRSLLEHHAIQGSDHCWHLDRGDPHSKVLQGMQTRDLADVLGCGDDVPSWQLTVRGMRSVVFCSSMSEAVACCGIREAIPLADRSTYEMQLMLNDQGWEWRCMPSKVERRDSLDPYRVGEPKVWYSTLVSPKVYLQALLEAQRLKDVFGVDEIPHGKNPAVYERLLRGQAAQPIPIMNVSEAPGNLQFDEGDALVDDDGHEGDDCDSGSDGFDVEGALEELLLADQFEFPDDVSDEAEVIIEEAVLEARIPILVVPLADSPLVAPGRWGCFVISIKKPGANLQFGAYVGSCKLHAKNTALRAPPLLTGN
jgi:hypothetical protein